MDVSMKQKSTHRQRTGLWLPRGRQVREGSIGNSNKQMQTTIDRMDRQQGSTVEHRELDSVCYDKGLS